MTQLLASVTSVAEAEAALAGGADIIDLKNPVQGALGALPAANVQQIVTALAGRAPSSATIGDLPMQPALLLPQVAAMQACGVSFVKIGFFGQVGHHACMAALQPLTEYSCLIAVLFADTAPDFALIPRLAEAGFAGVMLDTAHKDGHPLTQHLSLIALGAFVDAARRHGLLCGLAGSLREEHIASLIALQPDYLGFRGALCQGSARTGVLQQHRVAEIKSRLNGSFV